MLLHKGLGQRQIPKEELTRRALWFQEGRWAALLSEAEGAASQPRPPATSPLQGQGDEQDLERRGERANSLVHLGELSAARRIMVSEGLAPGSADTLRQLRARPQEPYCELSDDVKHFVPDVAFALSRPLLTSNLKRARRGAAAVPTGGTSEHLKVLLDDESCMDLFAEVSERLAQAKVPGPVVQALRLGRMVALRKSSGKVRGIVTGDVFRRLVARTIAQQLSEEFNTACSPFQYALSTRAGTECVYHALRVITESRPTATVVSIDGIGAFDHVSRQSMLGNLMALPRANSALPFVRQFYGEPSTYIWQDMSGCVHEIKQAEG
jgi:hypothetical protein